MTERNLVNRYQSFSFQTIIEPDVHRAFLDHDAADKDIFNADQCLSLMGREFDAVSESECMKVEDDLYIWIFKSKKKEYKV